MTIMGSPAHYLIPNRPFWGRISILFPTILLLDCIWVWSVFQISGSISSYAHAHGINNTVDLSIWAMVIGWEVGLILHLIILNTVVKRRQKVETVLLIISCLGLTGLCYFALVASALLTLVSDVFYALPSR